MSKLSQVREALGAILKQSRKRKLLPSAVVSAARNPKSPLHDRFNWDDSAAAHQWRLWQARQLIASVEIVSDSRHETIPAFVSLGIDRGTGGYRLMEDVMSSAQLRREMLATAKGELKAFEFRYQRLSELAVVFKAIKRIDAKEKSR